MHENEFDREKAWRLLCAYTAGESLRKHARAVEAAMRFYACRFGENANRWGNIGLLHDFDYEKYPDKHPQTAAEILAKEGYGMDFIDCILSHVDSCGKPRDSDLRKTLYAVDELCGFLVAVALVRPSKKIADVETKSVIKKMKDKAFARQVSRTDIIRGAEELGIPLEIHVENVLNALKGIAPELGL